MSKAMIVSKEKLSFLKHKNFITYPRKPVMNNLRAMIVPHAGLKYSGHLANVGYSSIPWEKYNRILLLSTHHDDGTFIPQSNEFRLKRKLYQFNHQGLEEYIPKNNSVFENEHSWIVQLPFLQKTNNLTIILVNQYSELMFQSILNIIEKDTLVIANTDLFHCGPNYNLSCPKDIRRWNENTIRKIVSGQRLTSNELCGKKVIELFRRIVSVKKWDYHGHYYTSSDVVHRTNSGNSVGYATILYTKFPLKELVEIPRKIMESKEVQSLLGRKISIKTFDKILYNLEKIYPKMNQIYDYTYGIFVTIENNKQLRGCIGTFLVTSELFRCIAEITLKSAFFDNRFFKNMIDKKELPQLHYKVNFISKPFVIFTKEKNSHDWNELYMIVKPVLQIGLHGISLYFSDGRSSTFLANVLIESFGIYELNLENWKKLLDSLVEKAGSSYERITKIELYECNEYDEFGRKITLNSTKKKIKNNS